MKPILLNLVMFFFLLFTACSEKNNPAIVKFDGTSAKQTWAIEDLNPEIPSDWSSFGFLTFEMSSTTTQRFDLILYDAEGTRKLVIHPFQGATVRASIPLIHFQKRN